MIEAIRVAAERPYSVEVYPGAVAGLQGLLGDAGQVAILHPKVLADKVAELAESLPVKVLPIELPTAEKAKTAEVLVQCLDALAAAGFTRNDLVVGFGGGATTDLAGFVAATWLRGVRVVTMPTTVLGMVDAAVGGKTGINIPAGKNLVGAFHEPVGVLCDLELLNGLPEEDLRAGMAEVVKTGFIADPEILALVERDPEQATNPASTTMAELIRRSIEVKATVVTDDLREKTSSGSKVGRELLNYGHTLGHAIENREAYSWRHGEAVSVGMAFVAELARRMGKLDDATADRHAYILETLGLPTSYDPDAWPELRAAMSLDKKARGGVLRFVILNGLASAEIAAAPSEELLEESYRAICG